MKSHKREEDEKAKSVDHFEDEIVTPSRQMVCGDGEEEEGKMPAVNAEETANYPPQCEKKIAGDAVNTSEVIDVDNVTDKQPPPSDSQIKGDIAGYRQETGLSNEEQDFADHISEISHDATVDNLGDHMPMASRNVKGDLPTRLPDMDDTAGPMSRAPASARASATSSGVSSETAAPQTRPLNYQVSTIPPPVPLRVGTATRQTSPGAYSVTPPTRRIGRSANADGDDSTVATQEIISSLQQHTNTRATYERIAPPPPQQEEMLIQATLVEDGDAVDPSMMASEASNRTGSSGGDRGARRHDLEAPTNRESHHTENIALVEAKPLEIPQRTFREAIQSRWTQLNIFLVVSLITIAVVLGVFAVQGDVPADVQPLTSGKTAAPLSGGPDSTDAPSFPGQPAGMPSEIPTWAPTYSVIIEKTVAPIPVVIPVVAGARPVAESVGQPSSLPSSAPTRGPLTREDLIELLPEYTIEAMRLTASPQFRAFEWLWDDPNIENYNVDRMIQRFALMTVLNSMGMVDGVVRSKNNIHNTHECKWNQLGLRCDENQKLSGIHMARVGLEGTIPLQIGLLTNLRKIDVSQNSLSETIPTTIGDITAIQVINVGLNSLSGSLPYSIAYMKQLRELIVNNNQLTSTLPAELGWLTHLRQLRMSYNSFTGTIPGTLRHLTSLETLILNDNQLSGALPEEALGDLVTSTEMELQRNKLVGTIPMNLGDLTNLLVLNLSENQLTGTVPYSLGELESVTRLELQMNHLRGTLPIEVCALKEFKDLTNIMVDCSELECFCLCVCFTDQPGA